MSATSWTCFNPVSTSCAYIGGTSRQRKSVSNDTAAINLAWKRGDGLHSATFRHPVDGYHRNKVFGCRKLAASNNKFFSQLVEVANKTKVEAMTTSSRFTPILRYEKARFQFIEFLCSDLYKAQALLAPTIKRVVIWRLCMNTGHATSLGALVTRAFWVAAFFGCRSASADAGPHALNGVIAQVPEPSTLFTLAVALIACLYFALRRRNKR